MGCCSGRYAGTARLDGKTAIITGCNTGIGKFTAMDFYKRGCRVIMACRDQNKAQAAKDDILKTTSGASGTGQLVLKPLDLSSLQSVRDFANGVMEEERRIDLLINNAGIMICPKSTTVDGFELQFGTNHLGHFLLTLLLLPRILASAPARIVNVSSLAHQYARSIDWENLNAEKSYSPTNNYAVSKLANVLFTKELARRLEGRDVNVYALHPGVVNTELIRHADTYFFPGVSWFWSKVMGSFQKDVEQGAATTLYCAHGDEVATESGMYYADMKQTSCSNQANNVEYQKKLWDVSLEMVQLKNFDPFVPQPLHK